MVVIERACLTILHEIEENWSKDGDIPTFAKTLLLMTEIYRFQQWSLKRLDLAKDSITPKLKGGGK